MKQLLPLLILFSFSVNAQSLFHCGADEMRINTLSEMPKVAKAVTERDAELEAFTRAFELSPNRGGVIYTIPVVFHVIHKYGNENISREQILDGLDVLNEPFRMQRADTADMHATFKPIHADCEIEFKLATKDPEGQCHGGINRIASNLTTSGDHRVKDLIHWDPSMYLNIYVVSNAAGLAGHAVWPSDADTIPAWDGIVIADNYVGSIGTSNPTQSVVLAHECGHYLNLHHIWGGNNVPEFYYLPVGQQSNCNEDDLVADTPNTIGWSNCNVNAASCGSSVDNVQNAMDYSYCNVMFTEGQKTRMRASLNSPIANRNNLWSNTNLIATGVLPEPASLCAADFASDETIVCPHIDNTISFSNTSYHGETDSVFWSFPGGFPPSSTQENPTIAYSEPGKHDVLLTVFANGASETVTKTNHITVLQDSSWAYPFMDWFEGPTSLDGIRWFQNPLSEQSQWELTEIAGHSGTRSLMVDNWDNPSPTIDELYGPPLEASNASQMRIAFKYAFAATETPSGTTRLTLQASRNCESTWSTRLNLVGQGLETVAPQSVTFIPTDALDWQQGEASFNSSFLVDGLRFRFVYKSDGNTRLFIDDVNVDITAGIAENSSGISEVSLYPNPASDQLSIQFELMAASSVSISALNVLGQTVSVIETQVYAAGVHTQRTSLSGLYAGLYMLRIETDGGSMTKRLIVD